jgi:L-threonylcarbamoyladenylate synthase
VREVGVDEIARAAEVLRDGGLVAFPTETVYGLGADATNTEAAERLFEVKRRPAEHPVIAHVADASGLDRWGDAVTDDARRLAEALWPGPCTVIVPRRAGGHGPHIVDAVTGGRPTVGLRMPDHPVALALLGKSARPIAAPSANRFGRVSPTSAADVRSDLGDDVDLILDGGPCPIGVESTIVDCSADLPVIRRLGGVTPARIEEILGREVPVAAERGVAPGTLPSHYAPVARVELVTRDALATRATELVAMGLRVGVLGVGLDAPDGAEDLTLDGDIEAFARLLYARLRRADALGLDVVLAVPPEDSGLGATITDRLTRAAGGRGS